MITDKERILKVVGILTLWGGSFLPAGCDQSMSRQPIRKPLQESRFFPDGMGSRPLVEGTVARGALQLDEHLYLGRVGKEFAATFPFPVTRSVLERGRERYNIFCSPCHDRSGNGRGIVVERGYRPPPSYHVDRLRQAPAGRLFDVVTRGFGAMPDYASEIPARDRWAIVAYIRALQLSQHARPEDVPPLERGRLEEEPR